MNPAVRTEPPESPQETAGDPRGIERRKARRTAKDAGGPLQELASLIAVRLADQSEAESSTTGEIRGCDRA